MVIFLSIVSTYVMPCGVNGNCIMSIVSKGCKGTTLIGIMRRNGRSDFAVRMEVAGVGSSRILDERTVKIPGRHLDAADKLMFEL